MSFPEVKIYNYEERKHARACGLKASCKLKNIY